MDTAQQRRRISWGRDDLEKEKGRRGQAPGDWVGADQRHNSSNIPWPVRECEPAECHRFPGDPVHPIPAQQGQNITTVQEGVSHSTAGNKTPWVRPGLPDCCDWRPVGGALVQSPQQRRSVLSPLKQGNFCRVCGVGEDRMRSLACRKRATGHFPTHGDAGRLSVWLNQHQTSDQVASQPGSESESVPARAATSTSHDRRESVRLPVSSVSSRSSGAGGAPAASRKAKHPPRTCTTDTTYSTVAHDCRPVGEEDWRLEIVWELFFFDRCTAPCSAVAPYAPCIVPEMGS